VILGERLHEVAPDNEPGGTFEHGLMAFGERDGLALVIGAVVAEQEIDEIDGKEWIAARARLDRWSAFVPNSPAAKRAQGSWISGMLIRSDGERARFWRDQADQGRDARLELERAGPAKALLEGQAAAALGGAHATLATQLSVRDPIDEVRPGTDGEIEVERVILTEGKALEAIDDQRLHDRKPRAMMVEEEQGVATQPGRMGHDGGLVAAGLARDLAEAGAGEQSLGNGFQQLRAFEVVGSGEGLRAEGQVAVSTPEALDVPRFTVAEVVAEADATPTDGSQVVGTGYAGAKRGNEARAITVHDLARAA
jgi:hypothetical protein